MDSYFGQVNPEIVSTWTCSRPMPTVKKSSKWLIIFRKATHPGIHRPWRPGSELMRCGLEIAEIWAGTAPCRKWIDEYPFVSRPYDQSNLLTARRSGWVTTIQPVIITRRDCPVSRSEGFSATHRIRVQACNGRYYPTLSISLIPNGCSRARPLCTDSAFRGLAVQGRRMNLYLSHPQPAGLAGPACVGEFFGRRLAQPDLKAIITDVCSRPLCRYLGYAMLLTAMAPADWTNEELEEFHWRMIDAW